MSMADPLCIPPPPPPPGCCAPADGPPPVPEVTVNPPGLATIRYRIGTFASFRRAMLDAVARPDLLGTAPNPFAKWHDGAAGDYQTILIELWAYLADILTFYQERIANEAFVGTATQRDSLLRLAELIDYRPNPGAGASGLVAFTVEQGKVIAVPSGFRLGSRPQPGQPAAVFETASAITARGEHSAIPLSVVAPVNQFAALTNFRFLSPLLVDVPVAPKVRHFLRSEVVSREMFVASASESIAASGPIPGVTLFRGEAASPGVIAGGSGIAAESVPGDHIGLLNEGGLHFDVATATRSTIGGLHIHPFVPRAARTIVLKGANTRLAVGDYVVVVENEGASNERRHAYQLVAVSADKSAATTTIAWSEPAGTTYDQTSKEVALYALRVTAGPFGDTAPRWDTLSPALTNADNQHPQAPYKDMKWDDATKDDPNNPTNPPPNPWFYLPSPTSPSNMLFLDGVYAGAKGAPDNPGWAVLVTDGLDPVVLPVVDARDVSRTDYTLTSKVTRLTFRESVPAKKFPLRSTMVLTGEERLTLQSDLPLPDTLLGSTLVLAGVYSQLQEGQRVILRGTLRDVGTGAPTNIVAAEPGILSRPPAIDVHNNLTTVALRQPLARQYARAGAVLMANVVDVTQGETVRDEVLGSGDGSPFQAYPLKQKPLTYLPSTDPEGLAAVQSTLVVTVNGVRWTERPTLVGSAPDAQEFTTPLDDAAQTTVGFGDGVAGSRPPTGSDNIHARYRKGLGVSGNLPDGAIQQLIDSIAGLQKVTNPLPSTGGADQESAAQIRLNAPASLRTFGRAVSAADHAALALSYPGIAKATAAWVIRDANLQAVPHPYVQLTLATVDKVPLAQQPVAAGKLRSFLDRHRDPNILLRILDFTPVYIDAAVTVDLDARFPRQATLARVQAALNPGLNADGSAGFFAFERLGFGQSIHLSAVYAAVQAVPGVSDARVTTLRRMDTDAADPSMVRTDIFIRPTEIAVIQNDPLDPGKGRVTVTLGRGGFVDT